MSKGSGLFRLCPNCGNGVHNKSKVCKVCGGASPWDVGGADVLSGAASPTEENTPMEEPRDTILPMGQARMASVSNASPGSGYVALDGFKAMVGTTFVNMRKGQPIPHNIVEDLLRQDAPIASIAESDSVVCCPHCRKAFALEPKKLASAARGAASAA